MWRKAWRVTALLLVLAPITALAEEQVDLSMVNRIRNEAFHHSEVMKTVAHLADVIGPRVTGSPSFKQATEWTRDQLTEWGLENAHLEGWDFGRGWSFTYTAVHMVAPHHFPLLALPQAWTPGTNGKVTGSAMRVEIESEKDLEEYRGKVAGKILFLDKPREVKDADQPLFRRYSEDDLSHITEFPIPSDRDEDAFRERYLKRWKLSQALNDFVVAEKVVAAVQASSRDNGLIGVGGGGSREVGGNPGVTALVMANEQYNWIVRLMEEDKEDVRLQIEVNAQFYDDDSKAYNTVAEILGTDKKDEIVMLGGHLDSWHSGTGATDAAAGCAVAMEVVRILKALKVRPRRTIRIALWGGEEQGLLGSRAYVSEHFASRPEPTDEEQKKVPAYFREQTGPLTLKPEHARLFAYFNLDNGSGKIRGIYAQENAAVEPIFEAWLAPFADLGADTLSSRNTGGTDHLSFDSVGLPGFQFIQDPLDYSTLTHHTTMDVYDHLRRDDLIQASAIMASFVYHAAMRPEMMPRKPMPREESKKAATENE